MIKFLLVVVLFISCKNNTTTQVPSKQTDESQSTELSKAKPIPIEILRHDSEIFFIGDNQDTEEFDLDNYKMLYYKPISGTYLTATMNQTNIQLEEIIDEIDINTIERQYMLNTPVKFSNFVYIGELSKDKKIYSNQNTLLVQELTPLDKTYNITYKIIEGEVPLTNKLQSPIYPISKSKNTSGKIYIFTDLYDAFRFSDQYDSLIYLGRLDDLKNNTGKEFRDSFFPYVPAELTNSNEEFVQIIKAMKARRKPYNNMHIDRFTRIPHLLLLDTIAAEVPSDYSEISFTRHTNFLRHVVEFYREEIESDLNDVFYAVDIKVLPIFLKIFTNYDITELYDITALYRESLKNYDVWECYVAEMPRFQQLLRNDIPMPNDLLIEFWDYDRETNLMVPVIHFLAAKGYTEPLLLLLEKNPDYDTSVTNHEGLTISQVAVKKGRGYFLSTLLSNIPSINMYEVTPSNETWVDLADQLPRYDSSFIEDNIDNYYLSTKNMIYSLAKEHNIPRNIMPPTNVVFDPKKPNSIESIQARILSEGGTLDKLLFPSQFLEEDREIFELNITEDFDLSRLLKESDFIREYEPGLLEDYSTLFRLLVDHGGVNVLQKDEYGYNLLMKLMYSEQSDLFEYLITKGVSIHDTNNNGTTLLHILFPIKYDGFYTYAHKTEPLYAEKILQLGIDVNAIDNNGYTAYSQTITGCNYGGEGSELLIEYGTDTNLGRTYEPNETQMQGCRIG